MDYSGKEIKALRKTIGMSQSEFGEALGVTKLTVINWELGKTEIQKETVKASIRHLMEEYNMANSSEVFNAVEIIASNEHNKVYDIACPYETFEPSVLYAVFEKFLSNVDVPTSEKLTAIRNIQRLILDFEDGLFEGYMHIWPDEYVNNRNK